MLACVLTICMSTTPVWGQDRQTVRLKADQARSLDEAAELVQANALEEALAIYDALLGEVELDLLYLNRGRILQRKGDCEGALEAFQRVPKAPRLQGVSPEQILKPLQRYRDELEATCPGTLKVSCGQPGMALTLRRDDVSEPPELACGEGVELAAGVWQVKGTLHNQTTTEVVTVRGTRETAAEVRLSPQGLVRAARVLLGGARYAEAQTLLEEALARDETQQTFFYIGEALMGQGKCQLAYLAIQQVESSRPSSELSPLQLAQQLDVFDEAFRDTCGERVEITCVPADATLRIDGGAPQVCSPAPVFLPAGTHTLTGSVPARAGQLATAVTREVTIGPGEVNRVELVVIEEKVFGALGWTGVAAASLGMGALISAVLVDRLVLVPKDEEFERLKREGSSEAVLSAELDEIEKVQRTNLWLAGAGLTILLLGGGLMLADTVLTQPTSDEDETGVSLRLGDGDEVLLLWDTALP